jgi:hypothetical protein
MSDVIHVFASHDWGVGQKNHERVSVVVNELRRRNIHVWFDETHMRGNILDAMCEGIDKCDVMIVFLTCNYMNKVQSGNDKDNVRREFMYGANTPEKMLCVKFDDSLPNPWVGPVRMLLGSQLYVNMTQVTTQSVDALVDALRNRCKRTAWKNTVQKVRRVSKPSVLKRANSDGMRDRVRALCEAAGSPHAEGMHLRQVVNQLYESFVGTVNDGDPLVQRVQVLEEHLGIKE